MTKKDYINAAKIISSKDSLKERTMLAEAFAELFQKDNDRFNMSKFILACNLKEKS